MSNPNQKTVRPTFTMISPIQRSHSVSNFRPHLLGLTLPRDLRLGTKASRYFFRKQNHHHPNDPQKVTFAWVSSKVVEGKDPGNWNHRKHDDPQDGNRPQMTSD